MKKALLFITSLTAIALAACDQQSNQSSGQTTAQQQTQTSNVDMLRGIETLKSRLAMNPNDFEALSTLGDMYFESSRYIDAFNTYDKAIAVNPRCADCYNDRGLSLFYLGDPTSALESFDKAVGIDPSYTHAWLSKGYVLVSQGRYQEAILPLNKVKELNGNGPLAQQADKFLQIVAQNSGQ